MFYVIMNINLPASLTNKTKPGRMRMEANFLPFLRHFLAVDFALRYVMECCAKMLYDGALQTFIK